MPIDFHSSANRLGYAGREADASWLSAMVGVLDPRGLQVADIGCGGGVYSRAWRRLGAAGVIGIDFSREMLDTARAETQEQSIRFQPGEATATGLPEGSVDVVFERALLHHLRDRTDAAVAEGRRILADSGTYIVQDRTPEDVLQPASAQHLRGFIFECFPHLLEIELSRRLDREGLSAELREHGFASVRALTLWEVRRIHRQREQLLNEIRSRTGRSILHELDDGQIEQLVRFLRERLPDGPLVESDRWTLWVGRLEPPRGPVATRRPGTSAAPADGLSSGPALSLPRSRRAAPGGVPRARLVGCRQAHREDRLASRDSAE